MAINPFLFGTAAADFDQAQRSADPLAQVQARVESEATEQFLSGAGDEPNVRGANVFADLALAPFRGLEGAARSAWDLLDFVTGDALPDSSGGSFLGESETGAGKFVQGVSQFLAGFVPFLGPASKIAKLGKVGRFAAAGAAADFVAFDGQEERLANLVQQVPALANPVAELLAADKDDNEIIGRLKNTLEGLGLGAAGDGLAAGLRAMRAGRSVRANGGTPEELGSAVSRELPEVPESAAVSQPEPLKSSPGPLKGELRAAAEAIRHPSESGRLNPLLFDTPEETQAFIASTAKKIRETEGLPEPQTVAKLTAEVGAVLERLTGKTGAELEAHFRQALAADNSAIFQMVAAARLLDAVAPEVLAKVKTASASLNPGDRLEALAAVERFGELIRINGGFGTTAGRALNARRFIKRTEIKATAVARELLAEFGGDGYLKKELDKLATAADEAGLSRLVRQQVTRGGKLLRIHNEYWINSVLSGPRTHVVNLLGNAFTTLFLPAERALGAALTGDNSALMSAINHFNYLGEAVWDSLYFFRQTLSQERNFIDARGSVFDIVKPTQRAITAENVRSIVPGVPAGGWMASAIDTIGKIVNTPSRFLMAGDELFKQLNYRAGAKSHLFNTAVTKHGLSGQAATEFVNANFDKLIRESGEAFSEAAIYREAISKAEQRGLNGADMDTFIDNYVQANFNPAANGVLADVAAAADFGMFTSREATFTEDLGGIGKWVQAGVRDHPILQLVLPFVRTPTNLLKFVGRRVFPFATMRVDDKTIPVLSALIRKESAEMLHKDPLRAASAYGRMMTGGMFFFSAANLSLNGVITGGGPRDKHERALLMETGWQPYSLKIGDTYVSYRRLDPFASFFGIVADWADLARRSEEHLTEPLQTLTTTFMMGFTRNITNKSYLAGLTQILEALADPERRLPPFLRSRVASYIPNLVAQSKVTIGDDPVMRDMRTFTDAMLEAIPGASKTLAPKRNILGEPVEALIGRMVILGDKADWVNPMAVTRDANDPVMKELANIAHGFQNPGPLLFRDINLLEFVNTRGQSAYDRWLELHGSVKVGGRTLRETLAKLFGSAAYKRLHNVQPEPGFQHPKIMEARRIISAYRRKALREVQREFPELGNAAKLHAVKASARRAGKTPEQIQSLLQLVTTR